MDKKTQAISNKMGALAEDGRALLAATADVAATPKSMQTENRKFPRKLSQNSSIRSRGDNGGSAPRRRTQPTMATAAMPNRSHASRNTGKAATRLLDKPT